MLCLALCGAGAAIAQNSSTAALTGTVTDSSGAVVPGVAVTVENVSTQVASKTSTNSAGTYKVSFLPPGVYEVSFRMQGFSTEVDKNVHLELDQTGLLNATLKVGQESTAVTVTSAVPLIDTQSSQVSTVFSDEIVHGLPLVGRTPTQLAILSPGTSTTQSDQLGTGTGGSIDPGRVNVGGSRSFSINATLDGAPLNLPGGNNFGNMIPSMDAVSEFSVVQGNFGAQYSSGTSVLNIVLRNGANQFHGSLFEFLQNDAMNATDGFSNRKQKLRYNQYGGSIGGPILRDKLFFFFAYQNTRVPSSHPGIVTVPTTAEKGGDFSALLAGPNPTVIYDPATGLPFANNQIPVQRFDTVAKNVLSYFPDSNYGAANALTNNYQRLVSQVQQTPIYNGKLNWAINGKHQLSFSAHSEPYNQSGEGQIPGPMCYGGNCGGATTFDQLYQASEQWLVSSRLVNSFSASLAREHYGLSAPSEGGNYPQKLGLTSNISQAYFPRFSFSGAIPIGVGPGGYYAGTSNTFNYSDFVTWSLGKHSLSIGGMFIAKQAQDPALPGAPSFHFNGQYTSHVNPDGSTSGGLGMADFLLGQVQSYSYSASTVGLGARQKSIALFVQDDWNVLPTLTVNMGLRYQYDGSWKEAHNIVSNFSPTAINPVTHTPGAIVFGSSSQPSIQNSHPTLFAPRIGFSKSLGHNSLINGAFGVFFQTLASGTNFNGGVPGYQINQNLVAQTATTAPVFLMQNGPPAYVVPTPANRDGGISNGQNISWWPKEAKMPYNEEYHLSFEHQIGSKSKVDISYVGARGIHLFFPRGANQVPLSELGSATDRTNPQSLRPFPQYQNIGAQYMDGISNYNALEASYNRRLSHDLTVLANYTFSKSLDTSSIDPTSYLGAEYQYPDDPSRNYAPSSFDVRNRGVIAYVWSLPAGFGERYLNNSGLLSQILGGWSNSGSFIAHSGSPLTVYASGRQITGLVPGSLFANCTGNSNGPKTSREWFSTGAFSDPGDYSMGTCSRNSIVGPGAWSFDTAIMKVFPIRDVVKLQLRADAFNVFNHRALTGPNATVGSTAFGTINSSTAPRDLQVGLHLSF